MLRRTLTTTIAVTLVFIITLTAKTTTANAASHDLSGCVTINDDRKYGDELSPTYGQYVPLVNVPIPVYIIDILGFNTYVGDLTTNSAGCFSGTVTGLGVPDDTTITVQMKLENSAYRVTDDVGTYVYELDKKSLNAGENANFGTIYGGSHNGGAMMWVTFHDAVDLHDKRFGSGAWASHAYPQLTVLYPLDNDVSNTNSNRIGITEGARGGFSAAFHELGHWIGMKDAASYSGSLGSYCQDHIGSPYPYTQRPYIYRDPDMSSGDCSWHSTAYETEKHTLSESHANLIRNVLWDGDCPAEYEDVELNFDGEHTVHSVGRALCDLLDAGKETVAALHSYGDAGNITTTTSTVDLSPAGHSSGATAYGTDGTKIYSVNIATGATKEIYDMTSSGETMAVVSSDGTSLCATTKTGALYCGKASGSGTMFKQTLPTGMSSVSDVIVSGSKFYAVGRVVSNSKVYTGDLVNVGSSSTSKAKTVIIPHISLQNWKEIYSESYVSADTQPNFIALNAAKTNLYLARRNWIETCSLAGPVVKTTTIPTLKTTTSSSAPLCSTGTTSDFAGSRTYAGYHRGAPTDSYLDKIIQLDVQGGNLYITDNYGVEKIDLSSPTIMEQYIGAGEDKIFINGLSRRSLYFAKGGTPFFAISGKRALFQPAAVVGWDDQRSLTTTPHGMYLIDDTKTVHQEYYCGEENVQKNARDVVHAFVGKAYDVGLADFLTVNMGLPAGQAAAIENTSWTDLKVCQTADISGTTVDEDSTGSGSTTTTSSSSSSKKFSLEDVPCGEADPDSQLPAQGQNGATIPFESHAPNGTEKLSVPESYNAPTVMEKN